MAMASEVESNLIRDIREDQLRLLLRGTMVALLATVWLIAALYTNIQDVLGGLLLVTLIAGVGMGFALYAGGRGRYRLAVWGYMVGVLAACAVLMMVIQSSERAGILDWKSVVPFIFPLLIMLAGGLLSPYAGIATFIIGFVALVIVPRLVPSIDVPPVAQAGAVILSAMAVLLAFLLAGPTYSIAEWALENYRVSRQQTLALRANRAELERTLRARDQLNRQLQEAREAAEEATRRRGQFLADMSHELRTPLNSILGFSESMLYFPEGYGGVSLPEPYLEDLRQIFTSGRQLLTVINDVLDLAKVDAGKLDLFLRDVPLYPVFEDCVSSMEALVRHKPVELRLNVPDDLPNAYADPSRVRQVLVNLIGNAVKFTDEGSIVLGAKRRDDVLVISVSDTGIGIAREDGERVFEEFGQIDHPGRPFNPGAGLGLTISKRLVEMQNGKIWFESEVGKGTTFFFTLPCAA
ncbi:MAG: hypothetical protein JXB47_16525 [Anaerolineae bacterium]|nr:hypothetical protein [Anaerolineae bacterium]